MARDSDRPTKPIPEHSVKGPLELAVEATAEMASLRPALEEVKEAAQALNAAGDKANQRIAFVEGELTRAGVGVEAWYVAEPLYERPYLPPHPPGLNKTTHLGYAKSLGAWGLAYRITSYTADGKPTEVIQLLRNAAREIRVDAVRLIPAVLREVAKALHRERANIERKLASD